MAKSTVVTSEKIENKTTSAIAIKSISFDDIFMLSIPYFALSPFACVSVHIIPLSIKQTHSTCSSLSKQISIFSSIIGSLNLIDFIH